MQGHVAAGNGSLGYLIERGVTPHFCVVIDAMPHMAEIVVPDNGVYYLLSTSCDPGLFDKLLKADCKIRIWNPLPANVGVGIDETSFQMREGGKGFRLLGEPLSSRPSFNSSANASSTREYEIKTLSFPGSRSPAIAHPPTQLM